LNFNVAWPMDQQRPGFGLMQSLDLERKFSFGGGVTTYWPGPAGSEFGLNVNVQYLPSFVRRVVNNPPLVGAVNVSGNYDAWTLLAFALWRYQLNQRLAIEAGVGGGFAFTDLNIASLAGVPLAGGSAVVPAWALRAAMLYALSDSIWFGPFVAYYAISSWNAALTGGAPVAVNWRREILIGFALTVAFKLL
jgi:hypothetical protein